MVKEAISRDKDGLWLSRDSPKDIYLELDFIGREESQGWPKVPSGGVGTRETNSKSL